MKGIFYKNNYFYISSHNTSGAIEGIYKVAKNGSSSILVYKHYSGEIEGIDYSQSELRILVYDSPINIFYINGL